jgi:hypothetical protein
MPRQPNIPNAENCSLEELDIAAGAAVSLRIHVRMMAIKALLAGNIRPVSTMKASYHHIQIDFS